jgi:hypothetical protein
VSAASFAIARASASGAARMNFAEVLGSSPISQRSVWFAQSANAGFLRIFSPARQKLVCA